MARKKTVSISTKPSSAVQSEETGARTEGPLFLMEASLEDTDDGQAQPPGPIRRAVYCTVYCVSYGVVFSAILLGKFIPGSHLIGRGIHDGSQAAQRRFEIKPVRTKVPASAGLAA